MLLLFLELISIPIMLIAMFFSIYIIQTTPSTIHNLNHRYQKTGGIGIAIICTTLLGLPEPNYLLHGLIIGFLIFHFFYGFSVTSTRTQSLVIVPSLLNKHQVQVHLATLSQPFTRNVYNDLFLVIEELKATNVRTVILVSPMFSKKTELRNTLFFESILKKRNIALESHPVAFYTKPWSCFLLGIQKYLLQIPSIQSLPLTRWHKYTLHI